VVEFLADHGLVAVDDQAVLDGWLTRRLQRLPDAIRAEVHTWLNALRGRGARAGRPRKPTTIQGYLRAVGPALTDRSARYQSLRQVTAADVTAQLDLVIGPTRLLVLAAMRSLFAILKARRVTFADPTAGLCGSRPTPPRRSGLTRPGARACWRGLAGRGAAGGAAGRRPRPALRPDLCAPPGRGRPGRRHAAGGRPSSSPGRLDAPAAARLARAAPPALARHRHPYLLVSQHTAGGLRPVTRGFVQAALQRVGTTAHQLRVDRLLAEVDATGGDPLTLTRLFGISDPTAIRYCAELGPLDHQLDRTH
jgi:hypothetical protein